LLLIWWISVEFVHPTGVVSSMDELCIVGLRWLGLFVSLLIVVYVI